MKWLRSWEIFSPSHMKNWQPLDRVGTTAAIALLILSLILVTFGRGAAPKVREFSWQNQTIGAKDKAFILQFSHPMDRASVENNLKINPLLSGKPSWAGRRMAYTLNKPAPYGTEFEIEIAGAKDQYSNGKSGTTIAPFIGKFRSRDRVFVYIGNQGEETGRLILYNLTEGEAKILTPPNLVVMDFKPYPNRDRILFSARDNQENPDPIIEQKLYTVTTGIEPKTKSGIIEQILDNQTYQNLKFDLSADGKTIVVQRVNRQKPSDFGLWVIPAQGDPYPMNNQPGGDFLITPDSQAIALLQGEGVALIPLYPNRDQPTNQPLEFLPKFGQVLSFAADGSAATMVKYNPDFTRSLYLVNNQGKEQELLKIKGSINNCQFDPTLTTLYCLLSKLIEGDTDIYQELPYITAINLNTNEQIPLIGLPNQRDIQMSLSPDGIALLFDHIQIDPDSPPPHLKGEPTPHSNLWVLPIIDPQALIKGMQVQPEELPLSGFRPQWLP